jgi:predicted dehydrogenase
MSNENWKNHSEISRRTLLKQIAAASTTLIPAHAAPQAANVKPKSVLPSGERVNLAMIGIGGQGTNDGKTMAGTGHCNIVALCDADIGSEPTQGLLKMFPDVPRFQDFRRMFDKMHKQIDAVVIAVPDHSHFPVAMQAMSLGKHVFVEKPLAHSFREIDIMMAAERKYKVAAQMGNQGHSGANYFQFRAWTEAGIIKDVTKIHAFMNGARAWHGWTIHEPPPAEPVPGTLDWDLWSGTARMRAFNSKYHPYRWRAWYPYGTGALGDWGAHILDTIHRFLELGMPEEIEAVKREGASNYIYPQASTIAFRFPARGVHPPVEVIWFDGTDNVPPRPTELETDRKLPESGKVIYSKDVVFLGGTHNDTLRIIPEIKMKEISGGLPRITSQNSDHYLNFLLACKGVEKCRSSFDVAGPLTQMFMLGAIAQQLGGTLRFDRKARRINNNKKADALLAPPARKGWENYYKL